MQNTFTYTASHVPDACWLSTRHYYYYYHYHYHYCYYYYYYYYCFYYSRIANFPVLVLNGCVFCMQILEDAAGHDSKLTSLTPAVLREALRAAGNIVKPSEAQDVLQYVIRDVIQPPLLGADCLAGLHLILFTDNTVQKFAWCSTQPVSPVDTAQHDFKCFFLSGDGDSQHIYDLMSASADQQVKPSSPWAWLSG